MNQDVLQIVIDAVKDINEEIEKVELEAPSRETVLYGPAGNLDSLSLVSLVVDIEGRVFDSFGRAVVLADEKAMSQRSSPFRSVGALADYLAKLLEEEAA